MRQLQTSLLIVAALVMCGAAQTAEWELKHDAIEYDRGEFMPMLAPSEPDLLKRMKATGLLAGYKEGQAWNPITGWVEYDLQIPKSGWYELTVPGNLWCMEYFFDGQLLSGSTGGGAIGNVWLETGKHVLRLQRWNVGGFQPELKSWILRASGPELEKNLAMTIANDRTIVRAGEKLKVTVLGGGRDAAASVTVRLTDPTKKIVAKEDVQIPASAGRVEIPVELPCAAEGVYELSLAQGDTALKIIPRQIVVVDTTPPKRGGELKKTLLSEIDCVKTDPNYTGQGGSKVAESAAGKYRESGNVGYLYSQHNNQDASWFAYSFSVPEAGKPYILEADCPDDQFRTFAIAVRDANPDAYPVAGGFDTGGCFRNSNQMQTESLLFWPRSTDLRALFIPTHNDRPGAAAAKIRIYRVDGEIPVMDVPATGGRNFANWYEEGDNFQAMYGGDRSVPGLILDADRWARSIASVGGDMLIDTVSVYQMSMYPSKFNQCHCFSGTFDAVRIVLDKCEKYGLGFVGEFHPECRDLDHQGDPAFTHKPRTNYLTSKDGQMKDKIDFFPKFHPLDPVNQAWYIGMVGEFADRYKDSPAFRGVSLRVMGWQNPALNNFHDLNWGYDDLTVGLFEKETGITTGVAPDDAKRFQARYAWLMEHAKDKWIDWRCRKVAEIYGKLAERVRQARPDLKIYTDVFDRPEMGRESGFDPKLVGAVDGVVVLDSRMPYGRQAYTYEGPLADTRRRDYLLDPAKLLELRTPSGTANYLFYSCYFEGTEVVVPPESLGYKKETRRTWISAVINPAGRGYLERYATALALSDVPFFSDGGNAYTLGQPILREFMNEFRRLPADRFASRSDAQDPVAVRELKRKDDFLFYAVNSERYPVRVSIQFNGGASVRRLATGEALPLSANKLEFELKAYELRTFQAPPETQIAAVTVTVPEEEQKNVSALVDALVRLRDDVAAGKTALDDEGKAILTKNADEAQLCLKNQHYWRARTMMENSQLAEKVFAKTKVFPAGLEFLADPRNLPRPGSH
jgi:hypothetical protein